MTGAEIAIPQEWIEAAAAAVVSAFGGMSAAIVALWRKVNRIARECADERAAWASRERDLTERLIAEMRRGVVAYNAPAPAVPTVPPPPESEPAAVRKLREVVGEQERDRLLEAYVKSTPKPPNRRH